VVQFTGATEIKSKHGSNYSPDFSIVRWVPRPAALAGAVKQHDVQMAPEPAAAAYAASLGERTAAMPVQGAGPTGAAIGDALPFAAEVR